MAPCPFFFVVIWRPRGPPPFPYTTLFRSLSLVRAEGLRHEVAVAQALGATDRHLGRRFLTEGVILAARKRRPRRSEEHTSELQSRQYLVCRLRLEKKKNSHGGFYGVAGRE